MSKFAKKSLGQHFLTDKSAVAKIIQLLPEADRLRSNVLEIGPGRGAITYDLVEHVSGLTLLEKDSDLALRLQNELLDVDYVKIIEKDALEFDFSSLTTDESRPLTVVSNLPYNVGTEILFRLIEQHDGIEAMVLMFQKEVALRLAATPGKRAYGIPSVLVQNFYDVKIEFTLSPGSFSPPPQVDSTVVTFHRKENPVFPLDAKTQPLFAKFIQASFNHRRKTLVNGLSMEAARLRLNADFSKDSLARTLEELGHTAQVRAEQLKISDFGRLFEKFQTID